MKKEKGWFYTEITTNAKRYASEAIESTALTNGYYTDSLERELKILNIPFCVYVSSGAAALAMSFIAGGATKEAK